MLIEKKTNIPMVRGIKVSTVELYKKYAKKYGVTVSALYRIAVEEFTKELKK